MMMNNSKMIADYDFWVKCEKWNTEQMATLLLGYNPLYFDKSFREKIKEGAIGTSMSEIDIEIILDEYDRMNILIINAIKHGSLKFEATPTQCYKWAVGKNIPVFEEFKNAIYCTKADNFLSSTEDKNNGKRRKQLYKIILSIAIKYKYNPEQNKNPSTSKFRDVIERAGLSIDDNTIREVVKTSYEMYKDDIDHTVFKN